MSVERSEQRRFPRFNYSISIKYRLGHEAVHTYSVTRDISVGGLRVLTSNFIPKGTEINIEIELPRANIINASATTVWSNRINHSDQYLSGMKFSTISGSDRKNISDLVSYALRKR